MAVKFLSEEWANVVKDALSSNDAVKSAAGSMAARIQQVVLDMIGRFPGDLDGLGARSILEFSRGDGHVISSEDVRLFETGL